MSDPYLEGNAEREPAAEPEFPLYLARPVTVAHNVEPAADSQHSEYERGAGVEPGCENFEIVAVSIGPVESAVIDMVLDKIEPGGPGREHEKPQGGLEGNGRADEK